MFEIIGPAGKSFLESNNGFLSFGSIFTKIVSLSKNQLKGLPKLALTVASVSFVACADATSKTQSSTPEAVVCENNIFLSFGDQRILLILGLPGNPATCISSLPFTFLTFKLFR
ncbi:hypothetical protein D3C86_1269770 [compost metagenome]